MRPTESRIAHNERMKYGALLTWGVLLYALMFLLWSGFMLYGFTEGFMPRLIGLAALLFISLIAGRSLRFSSWRDILPYSLSWTFTVAVLDMIFSVPFTGWALFADWNLWVGYSLILFVPLFAPLTAGIGGKTVLHERHES